MKFAILHAYSARNAGDGLLVDASVNLIEEAFPGSEYVVFARYPATFQPRKNVSYVSSRLVTKGLNVSLLRQLAGLREYDAIFAVGGGYLRFGTVVEALKTIVAHGPQVVAAALSARPAIYLPQSIGPAPRPLWPLVRLALGRMNTVYLRDDRSMAEVNLANSTRAPDLALLDPGWADRRDEEPIGLPIFTTRNLRTRGERGVLDLRQKLGPIDGFVQSRGGSNDDQGAVVRLAPAKTLDRAEYLSGDARRVVVAVRLHAALMGLRAGHWVAHLAYERKSFGAFSDLGLRDFVWSVYRFVPQDVANRVSELLDDPQVRTDYDRRVGKALASLSGQRQSLVLTLRRAVARA